MATPEVNQKIAKEARTRQYQGVAGKVITGVLATLSLYCLLYIGGVFSQLGVFIYPTRHNAIVLGTVLALLFLLYPATKRAPRDRLPWYDAIGVILSIGVNLYLVISYLDILHRQAVPTAFEQVLGVIAVVLILEGLRRVTNPALALIGLGIVLYPFFPNYLPGFLYGKPHNLTGMIGMLYLYPEGIYGRLMHLYAHLIMAFLIFGAFLQVSGAAKFFIDLALAIAGRFRGGPAKVAVLASSAFGTINGSAVANVLAIGPVTIPLMKSVGYRSQFAGAVEAVASNGGQIMPPVMGIAAFLMSDFLGISYSAICIAAILPALLYYAALLIMVDLEAVKMKLGGLPPSEVPSLKKTLSQGWFYLVPLAVLVWLMMVMQYSPQTASLYSVAVLIIVSWFRKDTRIGARKFLAGLAEGSRLAPAVAPMIGLAGMLTGVLALTGVGVRITGGLVRLAGSNLPTLLLLVAGAALFLGIGLPTSAVYILVAILLAPALITAGVLPIAAHFFAFYFGVAALITPPIADAAYVAAVIARASFIPTSFEAMRLGIVVYLVPFLFVTQPELLLIGSAGQIAKAVTFAVICVLFLSTGMQGYLLRRTNWVERSLLLIAGAVMMIPSWTTAIIGIAVGLVPILYQLGVRQLPARRVIARDKASQSLETKDNALSPGESKSRKDS